MDISIDILVAVIIALGILAILQAVKLHQATQKLSDVAAAPKPIGVTEPTAQELERKLKEAYEAKITEATGTFSADLATTSTRLSEQVSRLTTSVIEEELAAYQKTLEEVRATATAAMEKIRSAVEQQRIELREGMEADLTAERERLASKFDTKMGDVVASYIAESLGGGVDLGAQMNFIVSSLEAHKEELKKDLASGL